MSSKTFTPFLLLPILVLSSSLVSLSNADGHIAMPTDKNGPNAAGQIAVYWGQDYGESSLVGTCSSRNYNIVIIAFLGKFGKGQNPELTLADYCDATTTDCQRLTTEIQTCQRQGVKVLLSVGGPPGGYSLRTHAEAVTFADYLWNNFLGGSSTGRPLGSAILDGIDFDIRGGNLTHAPAVNRLRELGGRNIVLTLSFPCVYPPVRLLDEVNGGRIDYVWVQFYNVYGTTKQCEYDSDDESIYMDAWNWWSSKPVGKVFFGTLASIRAGSSGYIPPNVLISRVLRFVKGTPKYGGVMLWNKHQDDLNGYAATIKSHV